MNISEIIKTDNVLSQYNAEEVYVIILRLMDLGYIGIDHLEVFSIDDAEYSVSRCLRFGCDDRESFSNECIHECGFANIGVSHDVDKSCSMYSICSCFCHFT